MRRSHGGFTNTPRCLQEHILFRGVMWPYFEAEIAKLWAQKGFSKKCHVELFASSIRNGQGIVIIHCIVSSISVTWHLHLIYRHLSSAAIAIHSLLAVPRDLHNSVPSPQPRTPNSSSIITHRPLSSPTIMRHITHDGCFASFTIIWLQNYWTYLCRS